MSLVHDSLCIQTSGNTRYLFTVYFIYKMKYITAYALSHRGLKCPCRTLLLRPPHPKYLDPLDFMQYKENFLKIFVLCHFCNECMN